MFLECFKKIPTVLEDFYPCPVYTAREQWNAVPTVLAKKYIARGENWLNEIMPPLPISLWLEFTKTGNRSAFQEPYYTRRRMMNDLVMAECCEGKGRFMPKLLDALYEITTEYAWWIPAANVYIRDTEHEVFPDTTRPIVALFSAESGAMVSLIRYLFADVLDIATLNHIDTQLEQRIITPYLTRHFWWMGNGEEPMCNWTPWCTENVLMTAFVTPQSQQTRRVIVEKALYSLDCFLKDYGDDGCCNEGAIYFKHAGLAMMRNVEILRAIAPDAFEHIVKEPKICNMMQYIMNMHVAEDTYFNFADCDRKAGLRGVIDYCAAKQVNNRNYIALSAQDFAKGILMPDQNLDIDRMNLWELVTEAMLGKEILAIKEPVMLSRDIYYESVGVLVARDEQYSLAVKAGCNGDSHNHNDTGSITLYKNGKPFLIDIGRETYTKQTFNPDRYEIWLMQSAWHNLPTFHGVMQQDGVSFAAQDVAVQMNEQSTKIQMNIAPAYPVNARVGRYVRTVTFTKNNAEKAISIVDETDYHGVVTLSFLFAEKPVAKGEMLCIGDVEKMEFIGAQSICVEEVVLHDPILKRQWGDTIYRALVTFEGKIKCGIT